MPTLARTPHKPVFLQIRNFLAGRMAGATRDESLLEEVMKCLFCRKYLTRPDSLPLNDRGVQRRTLAQKYKTSFADIKRLLPSVFAADDDICLDPDLLEFVDDRLKLVDLHDNHRDPVGDLYEAFVGSAIRGSEGQFFTPQNAGRWLVEAVDPAAGERVIDPACGAGGFLLWTLQHVRERSLNGSDVVGIEKDRYLTKLAQARLGIVRYAESEVILGDSLSLSDHTGNRRLNDLLEEFDVVLTNPPFGKNIDSASASVRRRFELSHKWRRDGIERWVKTPEINERTPPQVLFLERIISLMKPGGRAGIVVPESLLSSRHYEYAIQYLREHNEIRAVVGMPESLFKSSGKGGTHTKTCLVVFERKPKRRPKRDTLFMGEAKWCGNDSRGKDIPRDDLPELLQDYKAFLADEAPALTMGYVVAREELSRNVLAPRYHNPRPALALQPLAATHELVRFADLVRDGAVEVRTGNEVGKLAYGTGPIPFVRTSDISNWEIKIDPKHCVSEAIYEGLRISQDVQVDDILMVRDGTYLIGSCAIITEYDAEIVYQSHIYKIRSLDHEILSPYLLLALLSCDPVQAQIRAKSFTQDIIDSLGNRLNEVVLPIPRSAIKKNLIISTVNKVVQDRIEARELVRRAKKMAAEIDPSIDVEFPKLKVASN